MLNKSICVWIAPFKLPYENRIQLEKDYYVVELSPREVRDRFYSESNELRTGKMAWRMAVNATKDLYNTMNQETTVELKPQVIAGVLPSDIYPALLNITRLYSIPIIRPDVIVDRKYNDAGIEIGREYEWLGTWSEVKDVVVTKVEFIKTPFYV